MAFKAFIKPFEAPQRSEKIKIYVNLYSKTTFWNAQDGKEMHRYRWQKYIYQVGEKASQHHSTVNNNHGKVPTVIWTFLTI